MYEYIYESGTGSNQTLILLHGTGGDERDLLPLAPRIAKDANVLSIRGNVSENGMNRYFKRHGEGHYDWEDLNKRAKDLYQFIEKLSEKYQFDLKKAVYLGFSNGSNIAIQMLINPHTQVNKGMLFAPMYPKGIDQEIDLSSRHIYLSMGENDPIVPLAESQRVIDLFADRGATVTKYWVNSHELNENTLAEAKVWFNQVNK